MLNRRELRRPGVVLRAVVALAACLGLAACAALRPAPPPECSADALLKEAGRLASLAPESFDSELARAKKSFGQTGSVRDRFQVALVAFTSRSRADDAQAVRLLEDFLASSPRGDPLGGLGTVLLRALEDRIYHDGRLTTAWSEASEERSRAAALRSELSGAKAGADAARRQAAEEKARADAARKQATDEQARAESLKRQLGEEQARAETLKRQLDGLREIDRILMEREKR